MEKGRFGPYELIRLLGSGGFAEVWLAEVRETPRAAPDLRPGRRVAVKVLLSPPPLAPREVTVRFDQEALIMKGLDHPNVVEVFDAGVADGGRGPEPYLAMEYVRGRTLDKVIEAGPVDEALALAVARQVTAGLVALQERDVLHRDIKPSNLILADDGGVVKIMDFGCARDPEVRMHVTQHGAYLGTALYSAPEQLSGEFNLTTDLHALGLVLYEMLASEHPYEADSNGAVYVNVLHATPRSLRSRDVAVSPFLEALILTLLEKDPADRIADAATLQTILEEKERSSWWMNRPRQAARGLPPGLVQARGDGRLHGRDDILGALAALWHDVLAGHGHAVLIHAADGTGKSRLVYELADRVAGATTGAAILYGIAYPGGIGVAPGAIRSALRGYFGEAGLEAAVERYLGGEGGLATAYAAFLRGEQALREGVLLDEQALRSATTKLLHGIASERPVLLVVEELHLSSEEGRALFSALAHTIADTRILLIGTGARELDREWRNALCELPHGDVFELAPLSDAAVRDIVIERVGPKGAVRVAQVLAEHADGNPLYVQDFLREYIDADSVLPPLPPPRIRDLQAGRVHRLDEESREILELAAVVGFRFDPTVVAEVLERPLVPLLRVLAQIHRARGMVRPAGEEYTFDSHALHELLLAEISWPLRREYHALVARVLEGRLATVEDDEARAGPLQVQLVEHYREAERRVDCLSHLDAAFSFMKAQHRHSDATALLDRVLAARGFLEGEERLRWLITLAEEHALYLHVSEEERALEEALALVDDGTDAVLRARLSWRRSLRARVDGHLSKAEALTREGLRQAEGAGEATLTMDLLAHLGLLLTMQGRLDDAQAVYERLLELDDPTIQGKARAHAHTLLGRLADQREDREAALKHFRACLDEVEKLGSKPALAIAHLNLGAELNESGRCDEAIPHLEQSLAISGEIGLKVTQAKATSNLAHAHKHAGRLAEALAVASEGLALHEAAGDRAGAVQARLFLGSTALSCGLMDAARRHLRRAQDDAASMGDPMLRAASLCQLSGLSANENAVDEAIELLVEAETIYEAGRAEARALDCVRQRAEILLLSGSDQEARSLAEEALPRVPDSTAPSSRLAWTALAAALDLESVETARAELDELGAQVGAVTLPVLHYLFWRADGDPTHLDAAYDAVTCLRRRAPPEARETILTEPLLSRCILAARRKGAGQ